MVSHPAGETLSGFVDGDLGREEKRSVERHLRDCAICGGVVADLRRVIDKLAELQESDPPASLWPGIASEIGGSEGGLPAKPLPETS